MADDDGLDALLDDALDTYDQTQKDEQDREERRERELQEREAREKEKRIAAAGGSGSSVRPAPPAPQAAMSAGCPDHPGAVEAAALLQQCRLSRLMRLGDFDRLLDRFCERLLRGGRLRGRGSGRRLRPASRQCRRIGAPLRVVGAGALRRELRLERGLPFARLPPQPRRVITQPPAISYRRPSSRRRRDACALPHSGVQLDELPVGVVRVEQVVDHRVALRR
eukprot:gene30339-58625_t